MEWRTRLNLLLLAGVVLAGWLAWRDAAEPPPPVVNRITDLEPADVGRLGVVRASDGQRVELARDRGRWWLQHDGVQLAADGTRVTEVLRLADAVSEASYAIDQVTPADFGLRPPRAVVTMDGQVMQIGAQEPIRYRRYVETGGRMHLVQDTAYVHLSADWTAFVDSSPLAGRPPLAAIEAPAWRLRRGPDGAWLSEPERPDTDCSSKAVHGKAN